MSAQGDEAGRAPELLVERAGAVMILTLNRPDARNSTSPGMNRALIAACAEAQADLSIGAIILTGAGKSFSAGGNIKNMRDKKGLFGHPIVETPRAFREDIQAVPRTFLALDVPLIAAINGHAIGAGLDFALMCDIRIASEAATFAESFIRVGLIPGDGGAWLLPRAVGRATAMEMALTAEPVDARRARELGLVSRVVAPEKLMDCAMEIAEKVARHSPQAIRMTKRLFRLSEGTDFDRALEQASFMQSVLQAGDDHLEAVTALIEQRPPRFSGS